MFVKGLSWDTTNDSLQGAFDGATSARVITDRDTGNSKGFGYIDFPDVASAEKAMKKMQGASIDGRSVTLDFATPRDNSSGGGRGGFGGGFGGGRGGGGRGRGGRGGSRGGFSAAASANKGSIQSFEGKKMTFNDSD